MPAALIPPDEEARLAALYAEDVLDSPAEPGFDRVARLAHAAFGGGLTACVAFVDRDRLWAKARVDFPLDQAPREGSLVSDTILRSDVTWVEDAFAEPRYAGSEAVEDFRVRFYAGAPVRGREGLPIGVLAVWSTAPRPFDAGLAAQLQDLADVVTNELELRRGRAALQRALDEREAAQALTEVFLTQAPVALAMFDLDMNYLRVSPRWESDYHVEPGTLVGRNHYDVLPDARRYAALHRRALAGEFVSGEAPITRADGSSRHSRYEMAPWRDAQGALAGIVLTSADVTDVVNARDDARRAQERLDLALNLSDTVVWERSIADSRLYASGPVESVFEKPPNYKELSADIAYGVHPADRQSVLDAWERHLATGAPYRVEHRYARAGGDEVWMHSLAEARYGADGRLERVVGVMRDITERKRFELELARAKDAAQAASRAKSEFLANMSHELRTPLNGVMGVASALARTPLEPRQREMVDLIESSAETLERLLGDILDLTRVESGRMELHCEPLDVADLLNGVATLFAWPARDRGVAFACEVADAVRGEWTADGVRLRQILTNLVSNAVKFTREGEIVVRADVAATGEVVFEVRDTGVGFDEGARARLFRRFEQADTAITRRFGGAGLGLAIARGLARLMGGELDARSVVGRGSTFRLTLPLKRAAVPSPRAPLAAAPAPAAAGLQVLLAEDHPVNRAVVELILQSAASVTSVENGREALDALASRRFDVVLMDVQMPVMDGLTATRALRAREAQGGLARTPVIALTANALPEHVRASRDAGADAHLAKPVTARALLAEVRRLTTPEPAGKARALSA